MKAGEKFSEIVIIGGSIESYWLALACAARSANSVNITLLNDVKCVAPAICVGAWLEDLHDLIGVPHEQFLQFCRPSISLGLEVTAQNKQFFYTATPTGYPHNHYSFARLFAALGESELGPYTSYNFAHALNMNKPNKRPEDPTSVMCEGLQVNYHVDGARYQQFLTEILMRLRSDVKILKVSDFVVRESALAQLLPQWESCRGAILLVDLNRGGKNNLANCEIMPLSNTYYFACNSLALVDGAQVHAFASGAAQLVTIRGELFATRVKTNWCDSASWGGLIKMGRGHIHNALETAQRLFLFQLRELMTYWPTPQSFVLLGGKFNRMWSAWHTEVDDFENLLLSATGYGDELTARNGERIALFAEVGNWPQVDLALINAHEWENIVVAGLGIAPGSRGLPRDVSRADIIKHMANIKQSFRL